MGGEGGYGACFLSALAKKTAYPLRFFCPLEFVAIQDALFNMYGAINTIYIIYPFCKEMLNAEFPWSNYGNGVLYDGAVDAEAVEKIEVL